MNKKSIGGVLFLLMTLLSSTTYSQNNRLSYTIEAGAIGAVGKQTPFWLMSNQYGLITPNKFNSWLKAGFHTQLDSTKKIDYDYGFDLVNRYSDRYDIYVHQAYARLKLWFINVKAGNIEEKFGDQDNSLSSGGLLWSGNARPMPKITIDVPNYTAVPFTKGYVEFKGGISHGWFGNNQFIKNAWLHQKYVCIQLGGKLPVHVHYGFYHYAEWGGVSRDSTKGKLPSGFSDFVKVFFAKGGSSSSPLAESINRLGNHLGSRNFGLDIDFSKYKTGIYWQTIFEDGSGRAYRNIKDGLWGIYLHTKNKNALISGVLYEFIHTTDQSGQYNDYWELNGVRYLYPIAGGEHREAGGNDNYFNNYIYRMGWTFHDMTIGTPLITSPAILQGDQMDYILNNKIIANHFAVEGGGKYIIYKVYYTYSLNYGTNSFPFDKVRNQQSVMIKSTLVNNLPWGLNLGLTLGIDKGNMYGNNGGIMITLIKSGTF